MTVDRFSFTHRGKQYQVDGTFGDGPGQTFVVTELLPKARRVFGKPGSEPSGLNIFLAKSAHTGDELLAHLLEKFPGLTNFKNG